MSQAFPFRMAEHGASPSMDMFEARQISKSSTDEQLTVDTLRPDVLVGMVDRFLHNIP